MFDAYDGTGAAGATRAGGTIAVRTAGDIRHALPAVEKVRRPQEKCVRISEVFGRAP